MVANVPNSVQSVGDRLDTILEHLRSLSVTSEASYEHVEVSKLLINDIFNFLNEISPIFVSDAEQEREINLTDCVWEDGECFSNLRLGIDGPIVGFIVFDPYYTGLDEFWIKDATDETDNGFTDVYKTFADAKDALILHMKRIRYVWTWEHVGNTFQEVLYLKGRRLGSIFECSNSEQTKYWAAGIILVNGRYFRIPKDYSDQNDARDALTNALEQGRV